MTNADIYKDIAERTGGDIYIGIVGPVRTGKSTFIKQFMENPQTIPDGEVDADEYIMLSLRLAQGLDFSQLKETYHLAPNSFVLKKLDIYHRQGFVKWNGNTVSLTPTGFLAENIIASDIMGNVEEII